jgi:glycosyltransferase involved in cell wall biosynthesis
MKLLVYSHFFAPSVGGVETIVLSLARGLAELRDSNGAPQFQLTLVTQTPAQDWDDKTMPFRVIRQARVLQLARLIRESDVVHVAGPALAPLTLGLLFGKPTVVEHHGFHAICPNGQLLLEPSGEPCPGHFMAGRQTECLRCNSVEGWVASYRLWLLTYLRRFLCQHAAANITPTQWLGGLLQLPRGTAILHGLNDVAPLSRVEILSGAPVIAFVGRLVTTKGVRILFEAAGILGQKHRPFDMLIVGDGPERQSLEELARKSGLGSRVRFAGRLGGEQLEVELAGATVAVVPSLGGEVFGLVVAENMLRGLPVVASDLGALAEVLGDAGLTFRTGDAAELAAAIESLLDNPSLAARLGQAGRQRASEFCNRERMIESHAAVYRNLVSAERDECSHARAVVVE